MLLYPHHEELRCEAGVTSHHRVVGSEDGIVTATFDLADLKTGLVQARRLVANQLGSENETVGPSSLMEITDLTALEPLLDA